MVLKPYVIQTIMERKSWIVEFANELEGEFDAMPVAVQDELLAQAALLERFGPSLGRPRVDTLNASKHANMKELRFSVGGGIWRVAFAFDPRRRAVLLAAGNKAGVKKRRFYSRLIALADRRYSAHLERIAVARRRR
jgi:hypothetical protein